MELHESQGRLGRGLALLLASGSSPKKSPETQGQYGGKMGNTGGQYREQAVTMLTPLLGAHTLPFSLTAALLGKGETRTCLWDTPATG